MRTVLATQDHLAQPARCLTTTLLARHRAINDKLDERKRRHSYLDVTKNV